MAIAYSSLSLLLQAAATAEATALRVTSPRRRVLGPQRINPQSTGLLDCLAGGIPRRPNVVHVALHLLSQEAQLICEQFEKGLDGVAIMWQTEDLGGVSKNHRVEWSTFLQGENLSETSLLRDFKIICKTGGPPRYLRCLMTEGGVSNSLAWWRTTC